MGIEFNIISTILEKFKKDNFKNCSITVDNILLIISRELFGCYIEQSSDENINKLLNWIIIQLSPEDFAEFFVDKLNNPCNRFQNTTITVSKERLKKVYEYHDPLEFRKITF